MGIGSDIKMKFGAIGDTVNLASRLEGLCKLYEVGVICSGGTFEALLVASGIICRQLDFVQVKGKRRPTRIYEVVGLMGEAMQGIMEMVSSSVEHAMRESTKSMVQFKGLSWNPLQSGKGINWKRLSSSSLTDKLSPSRKRPSGKS